MGGCRKEGPSAKPDWCFASGENFRKTWQFAARDERKTDDSQLTCTQIVANRECSGRIAKYAKRDPSASDCSKASDDYRANQNHNRTGRPEVRRQSQQVICRPSRIDLMLLRLLATRKRNPRQSRKPGLWPLRNRLPK